MTLPADFTDVQAIKSWLLDDLTTEARISVVKAIVEAFADNDRDVEFLMLMEQLEEDEDAD